jgi:hypothetical protein
MQVGVGLPPNSNQNLRPMEFGVSVNTEPISVESRKKRTIKKKKTVTSQLPVEDKSEKVNTDKELDKENADVIVDETELDQIIEE